MSDLQFQSKHSVEVSSDDAPNLNTFSYLSSRTVLDQNQNKSISAHTAVAIEEEVTVGELKSRNYVFEVPNKGQYLMSAVLEIHGHNMDTTKTVSDHIERIELLQHSNRNVLLERLDNANLHPTADAKMVEGTYDIMNRVTPGTIFYPLNFFFSETFRHLLLGKSTFSICVKFYNNSVVKNATLSLRTSHVYVPFGEVDDALTSLKQDPQKSLSQNKIPFTARTSLYYNLEGLDNSTRTYRLDIGDLGNHLKSFNVVSDALQDTSMLTLSTNKNGTNPIVRQSYQYFQVQSLLAGHTVPGFHFDLVDELAPFLYNEDEDNMSALAGGPVVRVGGGAIDLSTQNLYLHITGLATNRGKTLRLDVVHEECLHRDTYGMFYSSQNFLSDGISRTEPMSLERV